MKFFCKELKNGQTRVTKEIKMINVKLNGHEFRYEVFQILSLYYSKEEIIFTEDDFDVESSFDNSTLIVRSTIKNDEGVINESISLKSKDKKEIKNAIKMTLLKCLKSHTGISMPWGILVGIRPTKIIHELIKRGYNDEQILENISKNYGISKKKAMLALEVAHNEERLLYKPKRSISLYIGIPFCPTRCIYCSFASNPLKGNEKLVEEYLNCLIKEIEISLEQLKKSEIKIDTLYIGGGTPTALNAVQLERLLIAISSKVNIEEIREFTIEAGRPDSINMDKLKIIKKYKFNRISINPQSMNDETLKRVGRTHTKEDIIEKYNMARGLGFDNINMDIIIGLPGEGKEEIIKTMSVLNELSPDSITIHTMSVKRASRLNELEYRDDNNIAEEMYDIACRYSRAMGMFPYYLYRQKNMVAPLENVGYCKAEKECIYNIQMIAENISILSFGADAVTKMVFDEENRIERIANVKDVREYIKRIDEMIDNKIKAINMLTK